jgi:hypothetical protein
MKIFFSFQGKSLMVILLTIVSHYDYVFFKINHIILNALSYFNSSKSLMGVRNGNIMDCKKK